MRRLDCLTFAMVRKNRGKLLDDWHRILALFGLRARFVPAPDGPRNVDFSITVTFPRESGL